MNSMNKRKMTSCKQFTKAASYFEHLKLALQSYANPHMLGQHSPLAAPYFLGQALQDMPATALGRGEALRHELDQSLATLWGGPLPDTWAVMQAAVAEEEAHYGQGSRYLCQVLELNYFNHLYLPKPQSQSEIYHDILHISRSGHDRRLKEATNRLGELLLHRIRPAVRQEKPILTATLIGRDEILRECLAELESQRSVILTGPGGIGKTALGIQIGEHWSSPAVFWYTIRPTFNDHLGNLLFALAHFLHCQGVSNLWHQLIADGGQIKDFNRALGLVRTDLEAIHDLPLLCIDEVDLLRPADPEDEAPEHTQLVAFIESLSNHIPLLLMGQRAVVDSEHIVELAGLVLDELPLWLDSLKIPYTQDDIARLYDYTRGNPRLLELCIALYLADESSSSGTLSETLNRLPQTAAVLPLWKRIQRRLSRQERRLLYALAVFRSPAPQDAWVAERSDIAEQGIEKSQTDAYEEVPLTANDHQPTHPLDRLIQYGLIQTDGFGGIALLPAMRKVIYSELEIEQREVWHLHAAQIRSQRGEYTAAAYHCAQGNRPEVAVQLWYAHREEEIRRGAAATALRLFENISRNVLDKEHARKLALLRGQLYRLHGEPPKIVATLEQTDWPTDSELSADAHLLWGRALVEQGKPEAGLKRYEHGLKVLAHLQAKSSRIHFFRCQTYLQQRSMAEAWQETQRAQFNAELSQGMVLENRGHYAAAHQHYAQALETAQSAHFVSGVASCYAFLGNIANYQQDLTTALDYYQRALEAYDHIGDHFSREGVRSSLASAYTNSGRFQEAISQAEQAWRFFEKIGDPYWTSLNAVNLAESLAALGHLEAAEQYAVQVLDQEEPHLHPYALSSMGHVRWQQARYREAELYYTQAQKSAEMNEDRFQLARIWRALGEVQLAQAQYETAYASVQQALALFQRLELADEINKTNILLHECGTAYQKAAKNQL